MTAAIILLVIAAATSGVINLMNLAATAAVLEILDPDEPEGEEHLTDRYYLHQGTEGAITKHRID